MEPEPKKEKPEKINFITFDSLAELDHLKIEPGAKKQGKTRKPTGGKFGGDKRFKVRK